MHTCRSVPLVVANSGNHPEFHVCQGPVGNISGPSGMINPITCLFVFRALHLPNGRSAFRIVHPLFTFSNFYVTRWPNCFNVLLLCTNDQNIRSLIGFIYIYNVCRYGNINSSKGVGGN